MSKQRQNNQGRSGMALVVVMVIVTLVALAAYGFNQQMTDAYRSSQLQIERAQARLTALSAIEALRSSLEQPRGTRMTWHHAAPELFTAVPLEPDSGATEDDEPRWSFSVLAPTAPPVTENATETPPSWRFGLTNESAKINLLVLDQWARAEPGQATKTLMNLPGMSLPMAQAILRAYDINDTASATATSLGDRLGSPTSVNTPGISSVDSASDNDGAAQWARQWAMHWTGGDWDQNYQLDSLELTLAGEQSSPGQPSSIASSTDAAPPAWRDYLTFDSGQKNESLNGQPRVFLNGSDLQKLHQDLLAIWPADWANFVIAVRQFGIRRPLSSGSGSSVISAAQWTPDFSIPATVRITSSLELVGATVEIRQPKGNPLPMRSPFSDDFGDRSNYIRALVDDVTVNPSPVIVGQVDVMEASRAVLLGVPAMTAEIADQIIQRRAAQSSSAPPSGTEASRDTIAWLFVENIVDLPTLIKIQPWITVGGDCYHAQIVAFKDPFSPTFRCTVTLDGTAPHVAVRNFRQWDAWGKGFSIDDLRGELSPKTNLDHASSNLP